MGGLRGEGGGEGEGWVGKPDGSFLFLLYILIATSAFPNFFSEEIFIYVSMVNQQCCWSEENRQQRKMRPILYWLLAEVLQQWLLVGQCYKKATFSIGFEKFHSSSKRQFLCLKSGKW